MAPSPTQQGMVVIGDGCELWGWGRGNRDTGDSACGEQTDTNASRCTRRSCRRWPRQRGLEVPGGQEGRRGGGRALGRDTTRTRCSITLMCCIGGSGGATTVRMRCLIRCSASKSRRTIARGIPAPQCGGDSSRRRGQDEDLKCMVDFEDMPACIFGCVESCVTCVLCCTCVRPWPSQSTTSTNQVAIRVLHSFQKDSHSSFRWPQSEDGSDQQQTGANSVKANLSSCRLFRRGAVLFRTHEALAGVCKLAGARRTLDAAHAGYSHRTCLIRCTSRAGVRIQTVLPSNYLNPKS